MAYNKYKNQSTTMCKIENQHNCVLLTSGADFLRDSSKDLACGPWEIFILKGV